METNTTTAIPIMGVPILNRGDLLLRLANSIDFPINKLIIINNGRDSTVKSALNSLIDKGHQSRCYVNEIALIQPEMNLGVAASWNLIAQSCCSADLQQNSEVPYVMIVGNDIMFAKGDLKRMHDATANSWKMSQATPHIPTERSPIIFFGNHGYSFFCLTAKARAEVGIFDENIYPAYLEDCDYSRRIHLSGASAINVPAVQAVHGEEPCWGSSTIHSNEQLRSFNKITHARNFAYYRKKWGGINGKEVFRHPFNDETKDHRYWELDSNWRKGNEIWQV